MVAICTPVQLLRTATVPKLHRKRILGANVPQNTHAYLEEMINVNRCIYLFYLYELLVGPEGFEPPTKGL